MAEANQRAVSADAQAMLDGLDDKLGGFEDRVLTSVLKEVDAVLDRAGGERSSKPPETPARARPESVNRGGVSVIRDMRDARYEGMAHWRTQYRDPKSDHLMNRWFRSFASRDLGSCRALRAELNDYYPDLQDASTRPYELRNQAPFSRTTLLEGAPDPDSGLADGTGGELLPLPFAATVVAERNRRARVRGFATRWTSSSLTLRVPTSDKATGEMVAEGSTATQGEPTIASVLLSKKKGQVVLGATEEMMEDEGVNLISYFSERAGGALAELEDNQFAEAGTTRGASSGIAPNISVALNDQAAMSTAGGTLLSVADTVTDLIAYIDLVAAFFTVPDPYRQDSIWTASSLMLSWLSSILDSTGRPILEASTARPAVVTDSVAGQVGSIMGQPVVQVPYDNTTATADLLFGWHGGYSYLDGGSIRVKRSDEHLFLSDTSLFKFTERFDGLYTDANGMTNTSGVLGPA